MRAPEVFVGVDIAKGKHLGICSGSEHRLCRTQRCRASNRHRPPIPKYQRLPRRNLRMLAWVLAL